MVCTNTEWYRLPTDEDHYTVDFKPEDNMDDLVAEAMVLRCRVMGEIYKAVVKDARIFDEKFNSTSIDTRKKRHHFVPTFWQRKFANSRHTVEVDLNSNGRMRSCSPKDTAIRKHFYNLRLPQGEIVYTGHEDYLAHYESEASKIISKIINDGTAFLEEDILSRWIMSGFLIQCILRTSELERRWSHDWEETRVELESQYGEQLAKDENTAKAICDAQRLDTLLGNPERRERGAFFLFCRRWTVIPYTHVRLALPFDPVINFGRGAKTAAMILVPLDRKKMLVMHWVPGIVPDLRRGDRYLICSDILNHVQDKSGGKMLIHPDDQKFWNAQIKAWKNAATAAPEGGRRMWRSAEA